MHANETTREMMWARQQIGAGDIDYNVWNTKKKQLSELSKIGRSCIFAVDVYKEVYSFASEGFTDLLGIPSSWLTKIEKESDLIEEYIHPDDRQQLIDIQIKHSRFIYSLPKSRRNDYRNIFQFRMLNAKKQYVNIISRQQVLQTDRLNKAWIVWGMMDVSPDQAPVDKVKYSSVNIHTGEIFTPSPIMDTAKSLTSREKEVLLLIRRGLLGKEIAGQLNVSIHTVNNHRKSILSKLEAGNAIEAINFAIRKGIIE